MSRAPYTCRRCHTRIGTIRNGRVLTLEPGALVATSDGRGPNEVRIVCPVCRASRTFHGEVVIVPMPIEEPASSQ